MFPVTDHPFLCDNSFDLKSASTSVKDLKDKDHYKKIYKTNRKKLYEAQQKLYAHDKFSVLLIFQAMDAAGKDSTIRHVFRGVNPAGFQVSSFKQPSKKELDHDFLWRTNKLLPQRGRIGIFNRSYYEEVLVVRVHPQYLSSQQLPFDYDLEQDPFGHNSLTNLWQQRFRSINDHEHHLATNGTIIRKFFLNVSREEQHRRFKKRIECSDKNWKFSPSDLKESELWDSYMSAYQDCLRSTSTPWAPWYSIPADDKPAMRAAVSDIILETLNSLDMQYPSLDEEVANKLEHYKSQLIV
ncbi:PPK2 family polyphosphate kinase [Kangiella shandongensis]|uniref:PPK2 family polyphosphate kinase n=1 Tax=Kangiella shandongensis TaxID=2763258 RepID=UPI001CBD583F|nr:PPK2 family polyphosphate kinase [Kangiella shandongensis]